MTLDEREIEAKALSLSHRISTDLAAVHERYQRLFSDVPTEGGPTSLRYIGCHAGTEDLGRQFATFIDVAPDRERARRLCDEMIAQLQLLVRPASSRLH
jgi:hypothetical protein